MEPRVKDSLAENISGSMMAAQQYGISAMHCMTVSLASGGEGLGSGTFGPNTYKKLAMEAGFTEFAIVGKNLINNFYEIKGGVKAAL